MTNVTPIQQPAIADIRNALQLAQLGADGHYREGPQTFGDIARLLEHALEQLSEPNEAAIRVTTRILHAGMGDRAFTLLPDGHRMARDTSAAILYAQVTGCAPETL